MTAGRSPAELLDTLDALRASIGDSPAFSVIGFEQDAEEVVACFNDGGCSVFAECYGSDAAAWVVAAVNHLPALVAALRAVLDLADELEGEAQQQVDQYAPDSDALPAVVGRSWVNAARQFRAAVTAALTEGGQA